MTPTTAAEQVEVESENIQHFNFNQPGYFILIRREAPRSLMRTRRAMSCDDGCMFHTAREAIRDQRSSHQALASRSRISIKYPS